jgi:EAL and modified HD-GYP domain-containing signal transduction protein
MRKSGGDSPGKVDWRVRRAQPDMGRRPGEAAGRRSATMGSCVTRQPVFTRGLNIFGYELLYKDDARDDAAREVAPAELPVVRFAEDSATSKTIIHAFYDLGIARVTNNKPGFVNFTEKLLLDKVATILPPQILVIELMDSLQPTPEVIEACRALRTQGYRIALDNFTMRGESMPLLEVADIVKIEFNQVAPEQVREFSQQLQKKHPNAKLLAEKLETPSEFEVAKKSGFELFQGNFFSKPSVVKGKVAVPAPMRRQYLQLIRLSLDPDVDYGAISDIVKKDIALSYRLLRVVNSAFFGLRYTVSNIRQALSILGMKEIKKWITLISLSGLTDNKPNELVTMSLIRARFLELVAAEAGMRKQSDDLFLLGLMSMMDAIMDLPMTMIVTQTNIAEHVAAPLLTHEGSFGALLDLIICYERSDWDGAQELADGFDLSLERIFDHYLHAIEWAQQL